MLFCHWANHWAQSILKCGKPPFAVVYMKKRNRTFQRTLKGISSLLSRQNAWRCALVGNCKKLFLLRNEGKKVIKARWFGLWNMNTPAGTQSYHSCMSWFGTPFARNEQVALQSAKCQLIWSTLINTHPHFLWALRTKATTIHIPLPTWNFIVVKSVRYGRYLETSISYEG